MDNIDKVTVIVPVYRAERYIRKCVDSILGQTYGNIELLLVDDGSPDNSGEICDEYADKDKRVRVFHEKNSGVSTARNLALDNAGGKWVMFVDSDDWLEPDCLSMCVETAEKNNLDLLQFASKRVDDEGNILLDEKYEDTGRLSRDEYINSADRLSVCVGGNLLRNDIIRENHIRFDKDLKLGEDQLFIFRYTFHCKHCMKIANALYNYRYNPDSATATTDPRECIKSLKAFQRFEYRSSFEFYIQRAIYSYFLVPVLYSRIISFPKIYNIVKRENFNELSKGSKFEYLFFPLYKINHLLGLLYLWLVIQIVIKRRNKNEQ